MRLTNFFDIICMFSIDRHHECQGKLPTLCRFPVFSWVKDTSYDAVLAQSGKWDFPPEISAVKSEITAKLQVFVGVTYINNDVVTCRCVTKCFY